MSRVCAPGAAQEAPAPRRTLETVDEESQRDEMNAAIRAQRERGAVPRSMLPPEDEPLPPPVAPVQPAFDPEPPLLPEPAPARRSLLGRLLGR
jgi:hypothetical protein